MARPSKNYTAAQLKELANERNKKTLTVDLRSKELKDKLKQIAKLDGRSVNGWLALNVLPGLEQYLDDELDKKKAPTGVAFGRKR
jgi:hypothetical protein